MFQRLACGMAENQKALDVILQNKSVSSTTTTHQKEEHQTNRGDNVDNLMRVLRPASELCDIDTNGSKGEGSEYEEGIFPIDDL